MATLQPIGDPFPVGDVAVGPQFTVAGLIGNGRAGELTRWDMDATSWPAVSCHAAGRSLTEEEWANYLGSDEPYRSTCP